MAEQTSRPRTFDEWLAYQIQHRLRLAHMRSQDEQDWARSAWIAATVAAEERFVQLLTGSYLGELLAERDALRQRIAELEGR